MHATHIKFNPGRTGHTTHAVMHASKSHIQLLHYLIALPNPRRGCMKRTAAMHSFRQSRSICGSVYFGAPSGGIPSEARATQRVLQGGCPRDEHNTCGGSIVVGAARGATPKRRPHAQLEGAHGLLPPSSVACGTLMARRGSRGNPPLAPYSFASPRPSQSTLRPCASRHPLLAAQAAATPPACHTRRSSERATTRCCIGLQYWRLALREDA